jgi:energy-coupling factor transport system ATP-binding protein
MIELESVRFSYQPGTSVLDGVSLSFADGEFTAIIGNNGSGKSTLMKLILGLIKPTSGRIIVDGVDTRTAKVATMAQKIGFVFQNPNDQLFAGSVAEEVTFGLRNLGLTGAELSARLDETLERFELTKRRDVFPRFLARGDRQKVCIASVLAMRPSILLLDEPTTGQDYRDSRAIMELASQLNAEGVSILLVTHDLINVAEYTRRVIVLRDGFVVADGATPSIMSNLPLLASCSLVPPQVVRVSHSLADLGVPAAMSVPALAESICRQGGAL